ncbi:P-loop containing nucleoside triphosphate hydrolase protein [Aspergillus granulosus]|uniref:P-loop containing nucleoside triphosphate hydrolase protein n=1 Tax=Aspergillus granulosus TaxID=176169 RepID=A0ABR4HEY0_9EURO
MVSSKPSKSVMLADPMLLEEIDKLFAYNIGEYINLPQLVVVGEQSSGKSSVLEGLTKMAFPRGSGLCTRFATQIVFRRDLNLTSRRIVASIVPAPDTDKQRVEQLRAWRADNLQNLDSVVFSQMMADVHDLMGLSKKDSGDGLPAFSSDVLRLEISGPDEHHLSVIDVPGTFESTTPGLTTDKDKAMINKMVLTYMKNPRSIILAVIPANVDVATQKIDQAARDIDPEGTRTLRILTKPDLVDQGAEQKVVDLVNNSGSTSKFGWFVVRNLNHKELQEKIVERDEAEKEWQVKAPWSSVDKEKWGIEALKLRLQEILSLIVRKEFPLVRAEIGSKLKQAKAELHELGAERKNSANQRGYLLDIISSFQTITQNAKTTNYGANDYFDQDRELRLATLIVNRNEQFAKDMNERGHLHHFQVVRNEDVDGDGEEEHSLSATFLERQKTSISSRKFDSCPDVSDILPQPAMVPEPLVSIEDWLNCVYTDSRGFELGTFSSALLATAMRQQSSKWPALAQGYVSDAITIVHSFVLKTLEYACPNPQVRQGLLSRLMNALLEKYTQALEKAECLLQVERSGTPITLNHYFNDSLEKSRQRRTANSLERSSYYHSDQLVVPMKAIYTHQHMSNAQHAVREIHDILMSYYKVSRKRFVDNMCMQVVDFHLISGPDTPMSLFTPSFVTALTDEELEEIAGEEAHIRRKRAQLKKEISDLEAGRKIVL